MSTANLDESGFGAVELGVEVDAVIRTGNKANPVLVAGRVMGVSGHKCGGEVGVTVVSWTGAFSRREWLVPRLL